MSSTVAPSAEYAQEITQKGAGALTFSRLRRDRASMIALAFIVLIVIVAVCAPLFEALTGHGPNDQYRETGMTPNGLPVGPGAEFWLGTDHLGRDVLVRLVYGARVSLLVGVLASLAASAIAIVVGLLAGYFGGWIDTVLSRITDLVMSIPFLLCALALVAVFGGGLALSMLVIIFFSWAGTARVIRGQVIALREREFVEAAHSLGARKLSVMFVDILPNLAVPIIIYTTMMIPSAIVFEATLSFLGMGIVPPAPSWGGMLADAAKNSVYLAAPWLVVVPGFALLLTTLAFNILGDGIRDALDPRAGRRSLRRRVRNPLRRDKKAKATS
jgi:ABC-type dipeptide/oligopeptide/nickel transport system permease subunit